MNYCLFIDFTLKAYENGDRMIRLDSAYRLAQVYGVSVDELIEQ